MQGSAENPIFRILPPKLFYGYRNMLDVVVWASPGRSPKIQELIFIKNWG
jgi:hypothetical protein